MTAVTEDTGLSGPEKEMKVYNEACIQARKAIKGLIGAASGDDAPVGINVRKGRRGGGGQRVHSRLQGRPARRRREQARALTASSWEHSLQDPDFGSHLQRLRRSLIGIPAHWNDSEGRACSLAGRRSGPSPPFSIENCKFQISIFNFNS